MKILLIADPVIPVPPREYGGTERMADLLCRGLIARGHEVRLLAAPGSRNYGGGLWVHRPASGGLVSRAACKLRFQAVVHRAARGMDLVINFGRLDYPAILYRTAIPVIHWLHNPLSGDEVAFVRARRRRGDRFVAVSFAQIAKHPDAREFTVIPNAVDDAPATPAAAPGGEYALFLGRLTRNKGVHVAIAAARAANLPLVIAGNVPAEPGAQQYFEHEVRPYLGERCRWVGPYTGAQRDGLLRGALALLFPIQWNEPFGLVMVEALAAGVPVIATRRASTPEVVEPGRTGFLCDSIGDMALALRQVRQLRPDDCRRAVQQRFSPAAFMAHVDRLLSEVPA